VKQNHNFDYLAMRSDTKICRKVNVFNVE